MNGSVPLHEGTRLCHFQTACHKQAVSVKQVSAYADITFQHLSIKRAQFQKHLNSNNRNLKRERTKSMTYIRLYTFLKAALKVRTLTEV